MSLQCANLFIPGTIPMPLTDPFFATCDCSHVTASSQSGRSHAVRYNVSAASLENITSGFWRGRWLAAADWRCRLGLATCGRMSTIAGREKWVRQRHRNGLYSNKKPGERVFLGPPGHWCCDFQCNPSTLCYAFLDISEIHAPKHTVSSIRTPILNARKPTLRILNGKWLERTETNTPRQLKWGGVWIITSWTYCCCNKYSDLTGPVHSS